jgi:hypothetical protein
MPSGGVSGFRFDGWSPRKHEITKALLGCESGHGVLGGVRGERPRSRRGASGRVPVRTRALAGSTRGLEARALETPVGSASAKPISVVQRSADLTSLTSREQRRSNGVSERPVPRRPSWAWPRRATGQQATRQRGIANLSARFSHHLVPNRCAHVGICTRDLLAVLGAGLIDLTGDRARQVGG